MRIKGDFCLQLVLWEIFKDGQTLITSSIFTLWAPVILGTTVDKVKLIEKRLDRAICSQKWLVVCSKIVVTSINHFKSDHHSLLMEFDMNEIKFRAYFKFFKMWSLHPSCIDVITNSWKQNVAGCPMFILSTKLKILKDKLKIWNKEVLRNVH